MGKSTRIILMITAVFLMIIYIAGAVQIHKELVAAEQDLKNRVLLFDTRKEDLLKQKSALDLTLESLGSASGHQNQKAVQSQDTMSQQELKKKIDDQRRIEEEKRQQELQRQQEILIKSQPQHRRRSRAS